MTETAKTPTLAHSHVLRLQRQLEGEGFEGNDWESHRRLLDAAHNSTNGGSGDIRVLSENNGTNHINQPVRLSYVSTSSDASDTAPTRQLKNVEHA